MDASAICRTGDGFGWLEFLGKLSGNQSRQQPFSGANPVESGSAGKIARPIKHYLPARIAWISPMVSRTFAVMPA
jgi:hypothetical protein